MTTQNGVAKLKTDIFIVITLLSDHTNNNNAALGNSLRLLIAQKHLVLYTNKLDTPYYYYTSNDFLTASVEHGRSSASRNTFNTSFQCAFVAATACSNFCRSLHISHFPQWAKDQALAAALP